MTLFLNSLISFFLSFALIILIMSTAVCSWSSLCVHFLLTSHAHYHTVTLLTRGRSLRDFCPPARLEVLKVETEWIHPGFNSFRRIIHSQLAFLPPCGRVETLHRGRILHFPFPCNAAQLWRMFHTLSSLWHMSDVYKNLPGKLLAACSHVINVSLRSRPVDPSFLAFFVLFCFCLVWFLSLIKNLLHHSQFAWSLWGKVNTVCLLWMPTSHFICFYLQPVPRPPEKAG